MIWMRLAWIFLWKRWGQAVPVVLAGALGVAAVAMVMIAERELPKSAQAAFGGVDMVVGPKGDALDLVLCCVLHATEPRGLVPLAATMEKVMQPGVVAAAPIALGDNFKGVRIVGTTPDILAVYGARMARGAPWTQPQQAVLGAEAAHRLGLGLGDRFVGAHGLGAGGEEHTEFPYTVTGILAPTGSGLDRLILTGIDTVYVIHRHHAREEAEAQGEPPPPDAPPAATAVLVKLRSPVMLASLPRRIEADDHLSAAVPAFETARLFRMVRPAATALEGLGLVFAALSASAAASAVASLVQARARDLGLLRLLGAHPAELAAVAVSEALILGAACLGLGVAAVLAAGPWTARWLSFHEGLVLDPSVSGGDLAVLAAGVLAAVVVAAAVPAWRAARAPVEKVLG